MQNFGEIMKQVREMQDSMSAMQEELGRRRVTARSGGGMVTVVCNGRQEILSVSIEKVAIDPAEAEMLQDLVLTAVNEALRLSREMAAEEMKRVTGGLSALMPGGLNLPGLS